MVACRRVTGANFARQRLDRAAFRGRPAATGMKRTATRAVDQIRHIARNRWDFLAPMQAWPRRQQTQRVRMAGRVKNSLTGACSTTLPAYMTMIRSQTSAAMFRSCVMTMTLVPVRSRISFKSWMIWYSMVTSRPVVGSSAISSSGPQRDRHGDHHALRHAAGELMWICLKPTFRLGNVNQLQQLDRAFFCLGVAHPLPVLEHLADLFSHREHRVERATRDSERSWQCSCRESRASGLRTTWSGHGLRTESHPKRSCPEL